MNDPYRQVAGESAGDRAYRIAIELAAAMTLQERERVGWSSWQDLNVGLFFDHRNPESEQPGRCAPLLGRDLLFLLEDPPL